MRRRKVVYLDDVLFLIFLILLILLGFLMAIGIGYKGLANSNRDLREQLAKTQDEKREIYEKLALAEEKIEELQKDKTEKTEKAEKAEKQGKTIHSLPIPQVKPNPVVKFFGDLWNAFGNYGRNSIKGTGFSPSISF